MSVVTEPSLVFTDLNLIIFPVVITAGYLFLMPWASLWVKRKQEKSIISQHTHAVDLDIEQGKKQWELNKEKLRSNPEKDFLAKDVELDIQREKERLERRNKITNYIDKKVEAASSLAEQNKLDLEEKKRSDEKERLALQEKQRRDDTEKQRFEEQTAIHRATLASHRFPAAYYFMDLLSTSLKEDNVALSLSALSSCVAAIFGYKTVDELINDKEFHNDNLKLLKYIVLDENLTKKLDSICEQEGSEDEDVTPDLLFNHIYDLFDELPYELLSEESLAESISERVSSNAYDLLQSEELSGPMAETDTTFEEIELELVDYSFNVTFDVNLSGYASGSHRKEYGVPGQDLAVSVEASCSPVLGELGLKDYNLEISGNPRNYGDD
ncbi:hypothetical protein BCT61_05430 [Vibrio breoganii]|nr:hypothetical protein BCT98_04665 [Vibrio breoganii]PMM12464.1 hypothetical protein BCT61_05430 [Vibrio breoganii]